MPKKVRVILVTDGDRIACRVIETVAEMLGLRCLSASAGNPTPLTGSEIVELLQTVWYDPVLVMFDDKGASGFGRGEQALRFVASHPNVEVLGVLAVASNTEGSSGIQPDLCIQNDGEWINLAVDKYGLPKRRKMKLLYGDTVDILKKLKVPLIIGIGDIGKMNEADAVGIGAPVTRKAIEAILKRSGVHGPYEKDFQAPG